MTDLPLDPQARRYSLPASSRSRRLNQAAILCLVLLVPVTMLLAEMHPRIPTAIPVLIVGLPVAAIVLGLLARRKAEPPKVTVSAKSKSVTVVQLGVVIGVIVLLIAILLPSLCGSREQANRVKCNSNLRQIGLALMMYAGAHDDMFPPTLDVLITDPSIALSAEVFTCPSGTDERALGNTPQEIARNFREEPHHLSYVYGGAGLSSKGPDEQILMYERLDNHKTAGGMSILFGDLHVGFYSKAMAEDMVSQLAAGHNPPEGLK